MKILLKLSPDLIYKLDQSTESTNIDLIYK